MIFGQNLPGLIAANELAKVSWNVLHNFIMYIGVAMAVYIGHNTNLLSYNHYSPPKLFLMP